MAQHDYVIANGTGAAVRSDLNGGLAAIVSQNSGATAPSTTYAYQSWADTSAGVMKMRNGANNAWISLYELDGTFLAGDISLSGGAVATPSLFFTGDTNTGIYSPGADQVGISTGGTSRFEVSTTAVSSTLPVVHPLGAVGTPSITFTGDTNTGIWSPTADTIAFSEGGAEAMRIDSSGRLLVGTSTSVAASIGGSTNWPAMGQFNSTSINNISLGLFHWSTYVVDLGGAGGGLGNGPDIVLARSNANTQGSHVAVTNNILLGRVNFSGSDGTQFINGACIAAAVDGTPGTNDMPGRLVFSTTADGAASPTERMRIDSTGLMTLAGPGIKFPATQVASTDPNTLDDYEEGTWTPNIANFTVTGDTTSTATYTKIGRVVYFNITFVNTGTIAYATSCLISLPFAGISDSGMVAMSLDSNTESQTSGKSGVQMNIDGPNGRFFVGSFTTTSAGQQLNFGGFYRVS